MGRGAESVAVGFWLLDFGSLQLFEIEIEVEVEKIKHVKQYVSIFYSLYSILYSLFSILYYQVIIVQSTASARICVAKPIPIRRVFLKNNMTAYTIIA